MSKSIKLPISKRVFDIIMSFLLLILLSPAIIILIIALLIEGFLIPSAAGTIFYQDRRISQGKPFNLYKFRIFKTLSIKKHSHNGKVVHTKDIENNKSNLTGLGKILKLIYMDELPQLFNVLKGDMTLVGPRPTNVANYEAGVLEGKKSRTIMKAGITGYFQSYKGMKLNKSQEDFDMEYINYCLQNPGWKIVLCDIKILLITIRTIIRAEGI